MMVPRPAGGASGPRDNPPAGGYSEAVSRKGNPMNMPAQIPWPTGAEWNVKGCEFVDGQWRPKHPDAPPDKYLYREGHEFVDGAWVEKHMSVESDHVGKSHELVNANALPPTGLDLA